MPLDIDELRKKIESYFRTVTTEQLRRDLINAGLEVYSGVEYRIDELWGIAKKLQEIISRQETNDDNVFWRQVERQNIVRPTYPYGEVYVGSANNETNEIRSRTIPTSASTLNWSGYYGHQTGV